MLRNFAYGGLALVGGAITGIAISSWATPLNPPQVASEVARVASIAQPSMTLASTSSRAASDASDCSPWDVSEVAMEAALNEMIRRGWRPPSQAEVVEAFDSYGSPTVQALEPGSLVPVRRPSYAATSSEETEDATGSFPVDSIQPTSEGAPVETPAVSQPPPPPQPAIVIEEPTPPSN
jgi:hypothetical protein